MPLEGSRERITYIQPHDIISKGKHYLHSEVGQIMTTKLERISELSKQHPEMKFNSIGHLINIEMLKECHYKMDGRKAVGIDGISKEEYNSNLDNNLKQLVEKLKNKSYRPKPARKVEIPKENGKTRPLSIYSYEDKLVQEALRKVLESVFEPHFYSNMCGFRPNRNCHGAIRKLNDMIEGHKTNYILDADIKGFFDNINIGTVLIGGLAGAAFAGAAFVPGLGGLAGAFGIGLAANVATSSIEQKSIGEILFNGLVGGLAAGLAFGFGQFLSNAVYSSNGFTFTTFFDAARVDGANLLRATLTGFVSSWYKFLPNLAPGISRAILNMIGKRGGNLFND